MSSKIVRPVGTGALFNTSRHALGICRRVGNTCRYSIPRSALDEQSLETIIEHAVAAVVMRYGTLRVGIAGEDTKEPHFSFVEAMDLRAMVRWKSLAGEGKAYDDALLKSLESIHDMLWGDLATRPGWEVIAHHPANVDTSETVTLDVTFAFHHAYADGVASKLFHKDLLKALNSSSDPPKELSAHVLHLTSPPDLLPGMETIVPFKISWVYLLRTIWNEIIWQNLVPDWFKIEPSPETIPWTGKSISLEPHHVGIRLVEIRQNALEKVLKACRENGTTLTPLVHVLIATSLAQRLPADIAPAFSTTTPIDLRRYAKSEYDVTNNITGLVSAHDDAFDSNTLSRLRSLTSKNAGDPEAIIWQSAASLATRLRQKISTLPNDDICGMLSWISDWQKFWTDKLGTKRGSTWEVSNIGSFKAAEARGGSRESQWRIGRSLMTQGALPAGSAFSVNVAGVEGKGICLSLTWQETVVEGDLMDGLATDLEFWMERLGDRGSFDVALC